jgi:hypothetical protein
MADSMILFSEVARDELEYENPLDAEELGDESNSLFLSASDEGQNAPL